MFILLLVVDCGTLNAITNGQVNHPNGTTFGQTATYSCDTGYNLVEDITRTCQANGVWSGIAPSCASESNLLKIFKTYPRVDFSLIFVLHTWSKYCYNICCLYAIKLC